MGVSRETQVHAASDGIGVHVGREGLVHLQGLDDVGRDEVHLDASVVAFGGGDPGAVERDGVELWGQTADDDVSRLPLVVLHGDTRYAAQGFSDVLIWEAADLVGADDVADVACVALLVEGPGLSTQAVAHDRDGLQVLPLWGECDPDFTDSLFDAHFLTMGEISYIGYGQCLFARFQSEEGQIAVQV